MLPNELAIWCMLLAKCESSMIDLTEADEESLRVAALMTERGLLTETDPQTYTLTTRGMTCLCALERLKEFSLAE